jgi:hypothetical protein
MADTPTSAATPISETLIPLGFWGLIIVVVVIFYFKEDYVDILLDVSPQPELVSGMVTFEGAPVHGGVVHIVVSDVRNKQYLKGTTLPLSDDGKFTLQGQPALGIGQTSRQLRLSAEFHGTLVQKEKDQSKVKPLYGKSILYLNSSPPLGERFLWCVTTAAVLLLTILLALFTGDLRQRNARWLFILMYFFTFLSLALPIAVCLVVAQNPYLVDSMEESPIGLVKAKTTVLSEEQWLINIGGRFKASEVEAVTSRSTTTEGSAAATSKASEVEAVTSKIQPPPSGNALDEAGTGTKPAVQDKVRVVTGGIAVPFYIVILAMFGAGINMTLKVPEVQRIYENERPEDTSSLGLPPILPLWRWRRGQTEAQAFVSGKTASDIRQELIENYMYLMSAPFLAIAMYYLLQVVAEQVTQPVLVLMAFATGLISKGVISRIIEFAEKQLPTKERSEGALSEQRTEVAAKVAEAKARQEEAQAAARELAEARERQTAAEAAAKAAKEEADKADQKRAAVEADASAGKATQAAADTAKEEAEKAAREAAAKQEEAKKAAKAAASAAQKVVAAEAAAKTAQKAAADAAKEEAEKAAREAAAKQVEAEKAAEVAASLVQKDEAKVIGAEAAAKTAQEAKAKAAKADADAKAAQEATPPNLEAATDPTKKD